MIRSPYNLLLFKTVDLCFIKDGFLIFFPIVAKIFLHGNANVVING
jgi:hypothetical protein